jgi:hypothetical protein
MTNGSAAKTQRKTETARDRRQTHGRAYSSAPGDCQRREFMSRGGSAVSGIAGLQLFWADSLSVVWGDARCTCI